jgi:hypothetical protein
VTVVKAWCVPVVDVNM